MERSQDEALAVRVARLERQCLWLRRGGILILVAGACVAIAAVALPRAERQEVIEARHILLRDARGEVRVVLSAADERRPVLILYGEGQRSTAQLLVTPEGSPALHLDGGGRVMLGVPAGHVPEFELMDTKGRVVYSAPPIKSEAAGKGPKD
jgi:hypothetical protein